MQKYHPVGKEVGENHQTDIYKRGTNPNSGQLVRKLDELHKQGLNSRARSWRVFTGNYKDILSKSQWALRNLKAITDCLPRTKASLIRKNRNLIIREYSPAARPSPQSLFSRGFEGSNYSLNTLNSHIVRSYTPNKLH